MPIYPGFCLMQCNSNREEIGYSCFAMNIKGGRAFPGIPIYKPIKCSVSAIGVNTQTNRMADGPDQFSGQLEQGAMEDEYELQQSSQ